MSAIVLRSEDLNLPKSIADKLKGKKLEIIETSDGVLLKTINDPIKELRGFLKNSTFYTEKYLEQKNG